MFFILGQIIVPMKHFCITILLFLLYACAACGQQPLMRHFTVRDGLPSNMIYYVLQDSKGFLWFGTDLGISRFDGHSFKTFTSGDGLPDNEIFAIFEDKYGRCWLVCYNRKPCYILNDRIYSSSNDALCRQIEKSGANYTNYFINKNGDGCLAGDKIYIVRKDSISRYHPELTFRESSTTNFIHNKNEYIANGKGGLIEIENDKLKLLLPSCPGKRLYLNNHYYLYGNLFSGDEGIFFNDMILTENDLMTAYRMPFPYFLYDMVAGNDGNILLCTEKGIITYKPDQKIVDTVNITFPGISVSHIVKDKEGNTWYPTLNDGAYMRPASSPVAYNVQSGLPDNNVLSLAVAKDGRLITGYNNGSVCITEGTKQSVISLDKNYIRNRVKYIYAINGEEFLAGCDRGLYRVHIKSKKISLINNSPQKVLSLKGDHCLYGHAIGAGDYDIGKNTSVNFWDSTTLALAEDNNKTIWLGTLKGLYYRKAGVIKKWQSSGILSDSRITALVPLPQGGVAVGTHQNGIYRVQAGRLLHITQATGLISDICRRMFADSSGNVWLSTDKGLDKISFHDKENYSIYHYSNTDGLISNNVNDIAFKGSKAYVATSEGVLILDADKAAGSAPPKIYILSVQTRDSTFNYPKHITLSYNQNNLRIDYSGISFIAGNDVTYKYLLSGGNTDTVFTTLASVSLNGMKPGNYKLLIWAAGKNNNWSTSPAVFTFTIIPPVWQRLWFMSCVVLLCAGLVYMMYRRRISIIRTGEKDRTEHGKRIAALEMQALRAQINPHFMFNALNAIQHYYNNNDERAGNYYMSSFARLIRQTLANAKVHWIDIAEEAAMLRTYIELEQMRLNNSFDYEILTNLVPDPAQVKIPAMLLQPYVENAINHGLRHLKGEKGKLLISCMQRGTSIACIIDDNGIGLAAAQKLSSRPAGHTSMGMAITRQRIETINRLYNTNIAVTVTDKQSLSEGAHGTLIEIIIPLNTEL